MDKYLPKGLISTFWGTIKNYVNSKIPTKTSHLTNDSNFVNSTQLATKANDDNVVHRSGNETIDGTKTFTGGVTLSSTAKMTVNHAKVVKGTNPSSTQFWQIFNCDKNGANWGTNTLSIIEGNLDANGKSSIYFRACKNEANSTANGTLSVVYDSANNKTWAECPTPDANSNDKKIATTAWVTAKGYLTSHQSLSNYSTLANTVKSISISGKTITVTPGSGDAYTLTTQDTTYSNFVKSGSGAKAGLVPSPGTTAGTTKYLREDGTWQVPPDHTYTVNNATLTIQKNGSNVATFTANSSSNKTANITVPTKVSELTNDSNFVNTTQLAAKADDSKVVHLSGDEDVDGIKSFKDVVKIAGTYLGNEASGNERSCLYLTGNRDTLEKSGAYIVRFRQNRDQGALDGVTYLSQDILENGVKYTRLLVSGIEFNSDYTPKRYYFVSQSSLPKYLGIETGRWDYVYGVDANFSNSVTTKTGVVQENLVVSGNATLKQRIYFDNTNNTSLICKSVQVDKGEIPTVEQTFDVMLGDKSGGVGWVDRLAHLRLTCIPDTGDTMASIVAFSTLSTTDKGNASISVKYEKATNKFITAAPTPPANDNSTQIATTAWVNSTSPQLIMCYGSAINVTSGTIGGGGCFPAYQTDSGFISDTSTNLGSGTYKIVSNYPGYIGSGAASNKYYFFVRKIA
jgi:hypothetical protein